MVWAGHLLPWAQLRGCRAWVSAFLSCDAAAMNTSACVFVKAFSFFLGTCRRGCRWDSHSMSSGKELPTVPRVTVPPHAPSSEARGLVRFLGSLTSCWSWFSLSRPPALPLQLWLVFLVAGDVQHLRGAPETWRRMEGGPGRLSHQALEGPASLWLHGAEGQEGLPPWGGLGSADPFLCSATRASSFILPAGQSGPRGCVPAAPVARGTSVGSCVTHPAPCVGLGSSVDSEPT